MLSFLKSEEALRDFAKELMGESVKLSEGSEKREYKSDAERRELVRKYREAAKNGDEKTAKECMEALFAECEMAIYNLANSLSSGGRSKRSGNDDFASTHNDAEELKTIGVMGFIKAIDGGEMKLKDGTTKATGFDPDGPGTFLSFIIKYVEGYMKNAHTYEKNHFGLEKTSLDAPRGEDDDANLYNNIFADSELRFDQLDDNEYQHFLDSEAFEVLMDCLEDVAKSEREVEVFKSYWGVDGHDKMTPTELGKKYGVSKQRIDLMVKKTLKNLKAYFLKDRNGIAESASSDGKFVVKVGDKFVSSPASKLTSNLNFAGVHPNKETAEETASFWKGKTEDKIELVPYDEFKKELDKFLSEGSEEDDSRIPSGLDGKTAKQAKQAVNKLWNEGGYEKGIKHDESWEDIHKFMNDLHEKKFYFTIEKADYKNDEKGTPVGKEWLLRFDFLNQNGKETSIYGHIVASGCGTVEYPLEQYDILFYIN